MRPLEEIAAELEIASSWATGPKATKLASLAAELRGEEPVALDQTGAASSVKHEGDENTDVT